MLSTPALILLIVYILIIILSIITAILNKKFGGVTIISLILSMGFVALIVYDTECLIAGGCTIWSWIRTVLYIIFPVLFLILLAYALASGSFKDSPEPLIAVATPVVQPVTQPAQESSTTTSTTTQ